MNRLNEWKRRINATDFPDKQKACEGLDRIWATGEGVTGDYSLDSISFATLFYWANTAEDRDFWYEVDMSLKDASLNIFSELLDPQAAIRELVDAAKRYKKLRDLAERVEKEI